MGTQENPFGLAPATPADAAFDDAFEGALNSGVNEAPATFAERVAAAAAPAPEVVTEQPTVRVEADPTDAIVRATKGEMTPDLVRALLARIQKLEEQKAILEANTGKEKELPGVASESKSSSIERHRIVLDESRDATDPTEVTVSVNGRVYQMQRGKAVDVPPEVVLTLANAIVDRSVANFDERGMPAGIKTFAARRFPFHYIGKSRDKQGNWLMNQDVAQEVLGHFGTVKI